MSSPQQRKPKAKENAKRRRSIQNQRTFLNITKRRREHTKNHPDDTTVPSAKRFTTQPTSKSTF